MIVFKYISSVSQVGATLCNPMDCSTPGLCVRHQLIEPAQTHVHGIVQSVMLSIHHILCRPLLLPSIFHSIRVFSSEPVLHIRLPKYWSFSFSIGPPSEYSGLISFRIDWLISLQSKGLLRVFPNTTVQKHQFFGTQPSQWSNSQYMPTRKTIALTKWTSVSKVMSLSAK